MKTNTHAGQFNLRGKRTKRLRCGCCEVADLRGRYDELLAKREARNLRGHHVWRA